MSNQINLVRITDWYPDYKMKELQDAINGFIVGEINDYVCINIELRKNLVEDYLVCAIMHFQNKG